MADSHLELDLGSLTLQRSDGDVGCSLREISLSFAGSRLQHMDDSVVLHDARHVGSIFEVAELTEVGFEERLLSTEVLSLGLDVLVHLILKEIGSRVSAQTLG